MTLTELTPHEPLTPSERTVLRLLGQCQADVAIAASLHVTVKTVEAHVASIRAKLGVAPRHRRAFWVLVGRIAAGEQP